MRALCSCQRCSLRLLLPLRQPQQECLLRMATRDAHAPRGRLGVVPLISSCAVRVAIRQCGTTKTTSSTGFSSDSDYSGGSSAPAAEPVSSSSASSCGKTRTVRLHNLPRTWMHEEVIEFLHQVAEHAGIEPPPSYPHKDLHEEEEEMTSAVPHITSPFVTRIHIPFGRRTGVIYGAPIIQLTSYALANYLLDGLTFDPDDYRCRIYFSEVIKSDETAADNACNNEMELETEQQHALAMLDLDRYLLAPDLLYDMAKMRQRRLVTRNSRLLLHTFADDEETMEVEDDKKGQETGLDEDEKKKKKKSKAGGKILRYAGDYKELGRGSRHSVPLPLPYVQGRRGT